MKEFCLFRNELEIEILKIFLKNEKKYIYTIIVCTIQIIWITKRISRVLSAAL
jgi:hypothetical protein